MQLLSQAYPGYAIDQIETYKTNSTSSSHSNWSLRAHSPVQLLITDPSGRQTGYLPSTGALAEDIPNTWYGMADSIGDPTGEAPPLPALPYFENDASVDGAYTMQVIGTGSGPYSLDFRSPSDSGQLTTTQVSGTAATGSTDMYKVTFTGSTGGTLQPEIVLLPQPQRAVDTRTLGAPPAAGATQCFTLAGQVGIPADAAGVVLNATSVGNTDFGWLTLFPAGQNVPATSTVNFDKNTYAVANGVIVKLGTGGQVCVNVGHTSSHIILDATGFLPGSTGQLQLLPQPQRLVDTRTLGAAPAAGSTQCYTMTG